MTKISLTDLANLQNETTAVNAINANNAVLRTASDNTLSRDGTSPNTMNASIDMNNNSILNLSPPATVNSPARLIDVTSNPTIIIPATGTSGHTVGYQDTNNTTSGNNIHSGTETFNGSINLNGTTTFANPITNANLATMPNNTVKGNVSGSTAIPVDLTAGQLATLIGAPVSVTSINGQTGALTLNNGLTNSGSALGLTTARRTLPTTQTFTAAGSGTYTTPANCLWIKLRLIGGGGGGSSSGAAGTGSNTTFASGGYTGAGGNGGAGGTLGGSGGSASGGYMNISGGPGGCAGATPSGSTGGNGFFGGAGTSSNSVAITPAANSGAGGSAATNAGTGGGAGGYVEAIIQNPAASYAYIVGAGGASNTNGTAGAAGIIVVEEYYGS